MATLDSAYYAYYSILKEFLSSKNKITDGKVDTNLLKQMMDFYMENVLTAGADPEKLVELAKRFPKEKPDRKLRALKVEPDENKIKASSIARNTFSDYTIALEDNSLRDKLGDRDLKTLCRIKDPSVEYTEQELKEIDDWNDKIEKLFSKEGMENPDFKEERGTLIKNYMNECMDVLSHMNQLTSPKLEEKELRKNIWNILNRYLFMAEAGKMRRFVEQDGEVYKFIDENDGYCQKAGFLSKMRIMMMANPLYGQLDINALQDYDIEKAGNAYLDLGDTEIVHSPIEYSDYTEAVFESIGNKIKTGTATELEILLSEFHTYVKNSNDCNVYTDVTKCFCEDTNSFYQFTDLNFSNEYRDVAEEFRFTDKADRNRLGEYTECFSELPSVAGGNLEANEHTDAAAFEKNKLPVAFRKGDRVVVVSISDNPENGATTILNPQILYNYSLKKMNAEYLARLEAVDSARLMMVNTVTKSPFNKIMRCMKRIEALPELSSENPEDDIRRSQNEFIMLKSLCEEYIAYKNEQNKTLKPAEQTRFDTVKALKDYADIRLKELDLVADALDTIEQRDEYYYDYNKIMTDQDVLLEMKKKQPEIKAHANDITTQIDKYMKLEPKLPGKLLTNLKVLKSELKEAFGKDVRYKWGDNLVKCIGLLSTVQWILKERTELADGEERGKLENAFLDENGRAYQEEWIKITGKDGLSKILGTIPRINSNYEDKYRLFVAFNKLDAGNVSNILTDDYVQENICLLDTDKNERFRNVGIKKLNTRIKDVKDNAIIKEAYGHVSELIKYNFRVAQNQNIEYVADKDLQPAKELLAYNILIRLTENELRSPGAKKYMGIYVDNLGMKEVLECIMQSNEFKGRYGVLFKKDIYNDIAAPNDFELSRFSVEVSVELPGLLKDRLTKRNNEIQKNYENFQLEAQTVARKLGQFKKGEFSEVYENLMPAITKISFFGENGKAKDINSKISGDDLKSATDIVAYITGMTAVWNDRFAYSTELANAKASGAKKKMGEPALEVLTRVSAESFKKTMLESNAVKNVLKDMTYAQLYKFVTDKTTRNAVANKAREELVKPKVKAMGKI